MDYMLQRRIVVKGLGKQTDTKDPLYRKYTIDIIVINILMTS
jgi:hypothetical protein